MKMFINDQLVEMESELFRGSNSILDLLKMVVDSGLIAEDEIVMNVEIDGEEHERNGDMKQEVGIDFSTIREVKITKRPIRELMMESVLEGEKSCRILSEESKRIAEMFRGQKLADANDHYTSFITNIQDTMFNLSQLQEHIHNLLDNVDNDRFIQIQKRFQDVAQETITFQEDADWVMLADLLEYEFSEIFADFGDYFHKINVNDPPLKQ